MASIGNLEYLKPGEYKLAEEKIDEKGVFVELCDEEVSLRDPEQVTGKNEGKKMDDEFSGINTSSTQ